MNIKKISLYGLTLISSLWSIILLPQNNFSKNPLITEINGIAHAVAYNPKGTNNDALTCLTYSAGFFAASHLIKDHNSKKFVRQIAIVNPIARFISTRKFYNNMLKCMPILGKHITCTNKNCVSICNKCKIKHVFKQILMTWGICLSFSIFTEANY